MAVAFVQSKSAANNPFGTATTTLGVTFTANVVAGNLIAVFVTWDTAAALNSITDNLGNTYTIVQTVNDATNGQSAATAYAKNIAGGAATVTMNMSVADCCKVIVVHELSGADTVSPLDGNTGQVQDLPGTGADAVTSGNMTTVANGDYIFGGTTDTSGTASEVFTAGTGETSRENLTQAAISGNATASEDKIQTTAGAVASTFTESISTRVITMELAFKPTAAAGSVVRPRCLSLLGVGS